MAPRKGPKGYRPKGCVATWYRKEGFRWEANRNGRKLVAHKTKHRGMTAWRGVVEEDGKRVATKVFDGSWVLAMRWAEGVS